MLEIPMLEIARKAKAFKDSIERAVKNHHRFPSAPDEGSLSKGNSVYICCKLTGYLSF
jgi:hypothetical protein